MSTKVNKPKAIKPKPMQAKSKSRAQHFQGAAVSYAQTFQSKKPRLSPTPSGGIRIVHTEFVQDIIGSSSGNFAMLLANPVQPGFASTFPWLSRIAALFDSYIVNSIRFHYEPLCSTSTAGGIFMSLDPDASDPIPIDKAAMMSYVHSSHGPLWKSCGFSVSSKSLDALSSKHYVRTGVVPNSSLPTYDVGWIYCAIQATGTTGSLGEFYVTYDISMFDAGLNRTALALTDNTYVAYNTATGGFNRAQYLFGTTPMFGGQLPLSVSPGSGNITNVFFECSGTFWCVLMVSTTGTAPTANFPSLGGNSALSVVYASYLPGVRYTYPLVNATTKLYTIGFYVQTSGTTGLLTIDPTTFLSDNTANFSSMTVSVSPLW